MTPTRAKTYKLTNPELKTEAEIIYDGHFICRDIDWPMLYDLMEASLSTFLSRPQQIMIKAHVLWYVTQ